MVVRISAPADCRVSDLQLLGRYGNVSESCAEFRGAPEISWGARGGSWDRICRSIAYVGGRRPGADRSDVVDGGSIFSSVGIDTHSGSRDVFCLLCWPACCRIGVVGLGSVWCILLVLGLTGGAA